MIPCHVCGQDASTHWVIGLPPAPDSQKLALCPKHDSPKNKIALEKIWSALLTQAIAVASQSLAQQKGAPSERRIITVRFIAGGLLSFVGVHCAPTANNTLCIEEENGERIYIPMPQVRDYTVRPVVSDDKTA